MDVRAQQVAQLRAMSPEAKLARVEALRREALELAEAGVRMRHPEWNDAECKAEARRLTFGEFPQR